MTWCHRTVGPLRLDSPVPDDLEELHAVYSDPRVWTHYPTARHVEVAMTREMLEDKIHGWQRDGLSAWSVRETEDGPVIGNGGCSVRADLFWNLGYRFAPEVQGRGYATLVAAEAMRAAHDVRPELPVVAYLLEHNVASRRVAEKLGLELRHQAPDAGNPDATAVRLVFADRDLTEDQLRAATA